MRKTKAHGGEIFCPKPGWQDWDAGAGWTLDAEPVPVLSAVKPQCASLTGEDSRGAGILNSFLTHLLPMNSDGKAVTCNSSTYSSCVLSPKVWVLCKVLGVEMNVT